MQSSTEVMSEGNILLLLHQIVSCEYSLEPPHMKTYPLESGLPETTLLRQFQGVSIRYEVVSVVSIPNFGSPGSRFESHERWNFAHDCQSFLYTVCHYHLPLSRYDLTNVERALNYQIIIIIHKICFAEIITKTVF